MIGDGHTPALHVEPGGLATAEPADSDAAFENRLSAAQEAALEAELSDLPPFFEQDGFIIDRATGEVVGEPSEILTDADLERVVDHYLELRALAEAKAQGLQSELNALIDGLAERYNVRIREQLRRIDWLDFSNAEAVQTFGKNEVAKLSKAKSIKRTWGTIGFESSRESTKVLDPRKAFEFCRASSLLDAVRLSFSLDRAPDNTGAPAIAAAASAWLTQAPEGAVEIKILTSAIPDDKKLDLPADAFEHSPKAATQRCYVKTGSKKMFFDTPKAFAMGEASEEEGFFE